MGRDGSCHHWISDNNRLDEIFGPMPDLPPPSTWLWTLRRKATVIAAVHGGWVPIEEVCQSYKISVDEFLAWERDVARSVLCSKRRERHPSALQL